MKIILDAQNLLGDSFYAIRAIQAFAEQSEDLECVVVSSGLPYGLFKILEPNVIIYTELDKAIKLYSDAVVMKLDAGRAADYSYKQLQENPSKKQLYITEAYADLLGADLKGDFAPPAELKIKLNTEKTHLAISPFSRSCSRHTGELPNKTLDDWKWRHIISYLRKHELPVKVVAGPGDMLEKCPVPVDDYFTAKSLEELAEFMAKCKLLITLDNGLGHLASFWNVPTISLWPRVSNMNFIGPVFGKRTTFVFMDPNTSSPAMLLHPIRHFTRMLFTGKTVDELKAESSK